VTKNSKIFFSLTLSILVLISAAPTASAQIKLVAQKVSLRDGRKFNLNLPADYEIVPAAESLRRPRFFARAPDGRIFVTDMYDLTDNRRGAVYILDDWDHETGRFGAVTSYLTDLKNPNSAQFYTDESGQDWFYLVETDKLTRRKFTRGEKKPTDRKPQTLAAFPDYGLSYKYGGWHLTRTIAFSPAGKVYVSVGSSCNACAEKESVRATVLEMNADGSEQRIYAKGLRNAVDIKWIGKFLFATNQGADHLGANKPDETFYALKDGADYGWAACYQSNGKVFADPQYRRKTGCRNVPAAYAFFPAHSSALGFDYFDGAETDEAIKNAFLIALHGSTDKTVGSGYKIVIVRKGERTQDFVSGFLQGKTVVGRPCGIMRIGESSLLFTDDYSGVVYYVRRKGAIAEIAAAPEPKSKVSEIVTTTTAPESEPKTKSCFGAAAIVLTALLRLIF
jgi:glucose/arabinose dehydrogenase